MNDIIKTLSATAVAVGFAWIIQTAGLQSVGLLSMSPAFLFLGAVIAGAGTGAIAWILISSNSRRVSRSHLRPLVNA